MQDVLIYPSLPFFSQNREAKFEIKRLPNGSFEVRNGFFAMRFKKHSLIPQEYVHGSVNVEVK